MTRGINEIACRKSTVRLIALFLAVISNINLFFAQDKDFELWTGVALEANLFKNISFDLEEEIRFRNNASEFAVYFTDAGISIDLLKRFTFSGNYRFIRNKELTDNYSNIHRYYFDLSYSKNINRFAFIFRTRYQIRYENVYSSESGYLPEKYSRNKFGLTYNIYRSPLKVRLWGEFFYQLNNPEGNKIDKIRYAPELRYVINKSNELKIFYIIEKEYYIENPSIIYILGISYGYKI